MLHYKSSHNGKPPFLWVARIHKSREAFCFLLDLFGRKYWEFSPGYGGEIGNAMLKIMKNILDYTASKREPEGGIMNFVQRRPQRGEKLQPLDTIEGFQVRPGFYTRDGAAAAQNGVSFTIHSVGATSCTLLLFHPQGKEPYARLKFPDSYRIGNTYSMLVFGLDIEEFEYAFEIDGPYDEAKGLLFNKNNVLLDPYHYNCVIRP